MDANLQKQSSELSTAARTSSLHLEISRLLEQAAQVYQSEILPGQMRVWLKCFQNENPDRVRESFDEYFISGKFFPKPADIYEILLRQRQARAIPTYKPIDRERTRLEQSTPEWEASSRKARELLAKIAGKVEM